jgi:cytochrome c biogenesis protein CcmG/thiol:disulfide interchange protein DsbE
VAYLDSEQESRDFIEEFSITYANGPDLGTSISDAYRITGVPETFVVDQNGEIVFFLPAPIVEGQLDRVIEPLLSERNG